MVVKIKTKKGVEIEAFMTVPELRELLALEEIVEEWIEEDIEEIKKVGELKK